MVKWRLFFGFAMACAITTATAVRLSSEPLHPDPGSAIIAKRFDRQFPREHLSRIPIDDSVSSRAWTNYLSGLDYERVYFLEADIARLQVYLTTLDDQLSDGSIDFAYEVFELFKERVRNRCAHVEALLQKGFDLEKKESYVWKRKEAPWARDEEEWDELWRKRIKNEYVRRAVAMELRDTNRVDSVTAPEGGEQPDGDAIAEEDLLLSPEALILKRYKQQLTVLEDSDADWVLQRYLTAFAQAYDPHSQYLSANSLEDFEIEMKLSLVGIGALLRAEDGAAKVVRLIPGGPAEQDTREIRLRPGDKIIAVAEEGKHPVSILHWPLDKVVRVIRGKKGSRVLLTVIPASDPAGATTRRVDLIRDEVRLEEQSASGKVHSVKSQDGSDRRLGIIRLPAFYANMKDAAMKIPDYKSSASDVAAILRDMRTNGVEGVLIDLRNNGGGSLLEAVLMTGLFIETGPTVQVRERLGLRVLPDRDPGVAFDGPMVVLVNRLSASASEILAGALQDYGRAVIVGDSKTHGKGSVQSVLELGREKELGAIKVTTASYYRINGSSTQLRGVASDIVVPSPWDSMETGEDFLDYPMPWTQVPPATYTPVADLRFVIRDLRHQSSARTGKDARHESYRKLLERIQEMNQSRELPLNIEERKNLALMEKELARLQDELTEMEDKDPDEAALQKDLVLSEAAAILADFVALRDRFGPLPQPTEGETGSAARSVGEWLRSLL